jgi:hypothetical protein
MLLVYPTRNVKNASVERGAYTFLGYGSESESTQITCCCGLVVVVAVLLFYLLSKKVE